MACEICGLAAGRHLKPERPVGVARGWRIVWRKPLLTRSKKNRLPALDGPVLSIHPAGDTAASPVGSNPIAPLENDWRTRNQIRNQRPDHSRKRADTRRRESSRSVVFRTASKQARSYPGNQVTRVAGRRPYRPARVVATLYPRLGDTRNESDIFFPRQ